MVHYGYEERVRFWLEDTLEQFGQGNLRTSRQTELDELAGEHTTLSPSEEILLPIVRLGIASSDQRSKTTPQFLFPSYLFLRCAMNDEIYTRVCEYPQVYQILGRAYRIPTPLEDEEILHLRGMLESDCQPELIEKINIGETVEIVEGLMAGMKGRILAFNSSTVRIEAFFSFLDMGTSVAVTVARSDVQILDEFSLEFSGERACHA